MTRIIKKMDFICAIPIRSFLIFLEAKGLVKSKRVNISADPLYLLTH
jgi:hypothetical protein